MGTVGSTAWALLITVADPIPSQYPHLEPPVHLEREEQCRMVADAINTKASQAGVREKLSAKCAQIEFIEVPEGWLENEQKSNR